MKNIKCILFDCMETIIDMTELPTAREYALWAFDGSDCEMYWKNFEEFLSSFKIIRDKALAESARYKEHDLLERFKLIAKTKMPDTPACSIDNIAASLMQNYWRNYKSRCYVKEDVAAALDHLSKKYRLGIVSNFMVYDGIEELLEVNGIMPYFDFVTTSIKEGWRKPHHHIYDAAIKKSQCEAAELLFIGDDYACDYEGPRSKGIDSILLDRGKSQGVYCHKIESFYQLMNLDVLFSDF